MSSTNKYNTTYSAADIEKYLKGELSPREMHELENAALEDPFLADALDGMSTLLSSAPAADLPAPAVPTTPAAGLGRDLDELHTRLNARVAAGRGSNSIRRSAPRWSIAAAMILLLGIGCAIYYTSFTGARSKAVASSPSVVASSPQPVETTAPPKQATPPASAAPAEPPSLARSTKPIPAKHRTEEAKALEDEPSHKRATATTSNAIPDVMRNATPKTTSNSLAKADPASDSIAGATAAAGIGTKLPAAPSRQLEGRLASVNVTLDSSARISMANELYKRTANALVFRGRVLDDNDNPVPGASLTLKGYTNTGTVTDRQGQFKLYLAPQDSIQYLTVARIGYGQKSLPLSTLAANNTADHVIHLQPSEASLQEVVVTGYGSKRKETMATIPSDREDQLDSLWLKARPVIGRNAYVQYLDTAKKTLALDSSITGTETVSFIVDNKGTLTSFEIEQSLSPAHDEAIIRLVKEGPAWELLKQKKDRVQVSLHF
jgi:CarboxypepD_reg-like domain